RRPLDRRRAGRDRGGLGPAARPSRSPRLNFSFAAERRAAPLPSQRCPMLISTAMNAKLNDQITHEFGASQAYLAMACQFDTLGLRHLRDHFRRQTEEERGHALKFLDFIL